LMPMKSARKQWARTSPFDKTLIKTLPDFSGSFYF